MPDPSSAKIALLGGLAGLGPGVLGGIGQALLQKAMAKPKTMKRGGIVKKTGLAKVHKGERVIPASKAANSMGAGKRKIKKVMGEWKAGTLHSGSKKGPVVKNQKQAVAIALNQSKKEK